MTDPGQRSVDIGQMRLYDSVRPALPDDTYKLTAQTTANRSDPALPEVSGYFQISGPRFTLGGDEIVSVHPPANAQGSFDQVLPHVVLGRRTLPWERPLGIPPAAPPLNPPDTDGPFPLADPVGPWLALLLFIDDPQHSEVTVRANPLPISEVITDPTVLAALDLSGSDPTVNAIEVDSALLAQLAPTRDEVQLLAHVRQVNVDDRELSAGDSDGWFAVVMSNRLPTPGLRHRACLVSVEQRSDIITAAPPAPGTAPQPTGTTGIVLLHTWTFTAAQARPGGGSFKEISQELDAGLIGSPTSTTGYVALSLRDRAGDLVDVQYRGPLSPQPVARDPLGPYHSADQALRVSSDTAAEDVSYSAAFEAGRLLGAADARLAQELMRWRREAYRRAARTSVAGTVWSDVSIATPQQTALDNSLAAPIAVTAFEHASAGAGAPADLNGTQVASLAPGLDPLRLATAWNLPAADTIELLTGAPSVPPRIGGSPAIQEGGPS